MKDLNLCTQGNHLYGLFKLYLDILDKRPRDNRQIQIENTSYCWVQFRDHKDNCEECKIAWEKRDTK